jgi:hypothetical protein
MCRCAGRGCVSCKTIPFPRAFAAILSLDELYAGGDDGAELAAAEKAFLS